MMRLSVVLALGCGVTGIGCAAIDEARRAKDPASRRPGERTVSAEEIGLGTGAILTLDQGVHIALTCTAPIAVARARADQAAARVEQVNAGFLPQVGVSADYRWEKNGGAGSTPLSGSKIGRNSGIVQSQDRKSTRLNSSHRL